MWLGLHKIQYIVATSRRPVTGSATNFLLNLFPANVMKGQQDSLLPPLPHRYCSVVHNDQIKPHLTFLKSLQGHSWRPSIQEQSFLNIATMVPVLTTILPWILKSCNSTRCPGCGEYIHKIRCQDHPKGGLHKPSAGQPALGFTHHGETSACS